MLRPKPLTANAARNNTTRMRKGTRPTCNQPRRLSKGPCTLSHGSGNACCNHSERLAPTTIAMPSTIAISKTKKVATVNGHVSAASSTFLFLCSTSGLFVRARIELVPRALDKAFSADGHARPANCVTASHKERGRESPLLLRSPIEQTRILTCQTDPDRDVDCPAIHVSDRVFVRGDAAHGIG